jgi:hypothetical protein
MRKIAELQIDVKNPICRIIFVDPGLNNPVLWFVIDK